MLAERIVKVSLTEQSAGTLSRLLFTPVVDKTLAVIACAPVVYFIYDRLSHGHLDIVQINLILQGLLNLVPMLIRRTPVRITLNPLYWILTFVSTYWVVFIGLDSSPSVALVPPWFTVFLSCFGLVLAAYARLSLGRNIGFVPAQRELVMTGAYALVRHPIYTAIFVNYLAMLLRHYTLLHLILVGIGIFWYLLKSVVEERFLAKDPDYKRYMSLVRKRWIPGLV